MLLYCEKTLIKRILGIVLWEETNVPKVVSSNPGPYTGWTFFTYLFRYCKICNVFLKRRK